MNIVLAAEMRKAIITSAARDQDDYLVDDEKEDY